MSKLTLGYVNFFVTDFERSLKFFRDQLGLAVPTNEASLGYAS
jgi:catechol 2,3-dioxygenase-like lactoylglutathione lyase family enzyme